MFLFVFLIIICFFELPTLINSQIGKYLGVDNIYLRIFEILEQKLNGKSLIAFVVLQCELSLLSAF